MKTASLSALLLSVLLSAGCSTPHSVANLSGHGTSQIFDADFDRVWSAAVACAQSDDLYILNADKSAGYISAKRGWRPETFGENVGIWVRKAGTHQVEVEVVSRQAGPPIIALRNWEHRLLGNISANLTT
jgi:hypothetical protein